GAGIGLYIAFIGLSSAGIVVDNEATLVGLGDITDPNVLLTIFGLVVAVILITRGIKAGIFYGMIITAIAGMIFGLIPTPQGINDIVGSVPSLSPTFGQAFANFGDIFTIEMLVVILTF